MSNNVKYVDLITSLPYNGNLFSSKEIPISRIRLDIFLNRLEEEDLRTLLKYEKIINSHATYRDIKDQIFFNKVGDFLEKISNNLIKELLTERTKLIILIGFLRKKVLDEKIEYNIKSETFSSFISYLKNHSELPDLGLSHKYPWIIQLIKLMKEGNSVAAERIILAFIWKYLFKISCIYEFNFEAIILYITRWNIIERWVNYNSEEAKKRMVTITDNILEDYLK